MMSAALIIISIIAIFAIIKWLNQYVATCTLLYFLQKKYTLPNDEEMAECKDFVLKNIVKDILGRS